jgi:hypothetical protein
MLPYFKKHQTYDEVEKKYGQKNKLWNPIGAKEKYHGTEGPIHTSFNDYFEPFEEEFCDAAYEVGGKDPTIVDAWSGGRCNPNDLHIEDID